MTDLELLAANAWRLMDHRNIILANEEWRNTPVDIDSGVSMGKLPQATVGAYLTFWLGEGCVECEPGHRGAKNGVTVGSLGLVCRLLGNAGTGTNSCPTVWSDGSFFSESVKFADVRASYLAACKAYPVKEGEGLPSLSALLEALNTLNPKR